MKKLLLFPAIILCIAIAACNKVKQLAFINVDIPYSGQITIQQIQGDTFGIPLPPGGASLPFPAVPFATNYKASVSQYGTSTDKILKVDLKSFSLQILSPSNQNYDFMDSIQVFLSAPSQPEVLIAYQYGIPKGLMTLTLTTDTSVNLKNYFTQDTMNYRLNTHINAVPQTGTEMKISPVINLQANPLQ